MLILHPVTVYGVGAVAFAVPVGARVVDATAYSRHGEIAAAIPFSAPNGVAAFGIWLKPGQHGVARASGRIGSGTANGIAWIVTACRSFVQGGGGRCQPAGGVEPGVRRARGHWRVPGPKDGGIDIAAYI